MAYRHHPVPPVSAEAIAARARGERRGWGRWAAGLLLVAGLDGVAYAFPGSPVPGWVHAVVDTFTGNGNPPTPSNQVTPAAPGEATDGISVTPGSDFTILFLHVADSGQARITLTGDSDIVVRAPGGAATYTSDLNRLVINNQPTSATFEIAIPSRAPGWQSRSRAGGFSSRTTAGSATSVNQQYLLPLQP